MSDLKFQLLCSNVVEHYSLLPIEYVSVEESNCTLYKDISDDKLRDKIEYTHKKYSSSNKELTGTEEVILVDGYSGLVVMKDVDTDTTIIVEVPFYDHDGNEFYLSTKDGYVEVSKDTVFTEDFISQLLTGTAKFDSTITVDNNIITIDPNNSCWIDYMEDCITCNEINNKNSKQYYDKIEELSDELEVRIDDTSFLEVLLADYKGKIVHTEVDHCGGIMKIQELKSLDELDYIRVHTCL